MKDLDINRSSFYLNIEQSVKLVALNVVSTKMKQQLVFSHGLTLTTTDIIFLLRTPYKYNTGQALAGGKACRPYRAEGDLVDHSSTKSNPSGFVLPCLWPKRQSIYCPW